MLVPKEAKGEIGKKTVQEEAAGERGKKIIRPNNQGIHPLLRVTFLQLNRVGYHNKCLKIRYH